MADKDLRLIQETTNGNLTEISLTPVEGQVVTFDSNLDPVMGAGGGGGGSDYSSDTAIHIGSGAGGTGDPSIAIGQATVNGANSVAIGPYTSTPNTMSVAIGRSASTGVGSKATALGYHSHAYAPSSVSVGKATVAVAATYGIAIGYQANPQAPKGICIGYTANTTADAGIAIGAAVAADNAVAIGTSANGGAQTNGVAIGNGTHCYPDGVAIGTSTYTQYASRATVIGWNTSTVSDNSIVIGSSGYSGSYLATSDHSIAIGTLVSVLTNSTYAIALGKSSSATNSASSITIGKGATVANAGYGMAIGSQSSASAYNACSIGPNVSNSTAYSLNIGPNNTDKVSILNSGDVVFPVADGTASLTAGQFQFYVNQADNTVRARFHDGEGIEDIVIATGV